VTIGRAKASATSTTSVPSGPANDASDRQPRRPPAARAHQILAQIDRPARKADPAQGQRDQRNDDGRGEIRIFQRVESQITLLDDGRISGLVGRQRVAELVDTDAEHPGGRDEGEGDDPRRRDPGGHGPA